MEHRTHYDGSSASHTSGQQQQAASQSSASAARPSSASAYAASSAALRRSPFVRRMQRLGLVGETKPLVGLWAAGFTMLAVMMYRSMGEHLRVRNADRALRSGGDLDDTADEQKDDRGSDDKGSSGSGGGGGGGGGGGAATFAPANQVAASASPPTPASSDGARAGATSHARAASSVFSPLPSDHNAYTHATITQTRVRSTTGDREIGITEGAGLWSEHDPADLEAVLSHVEPPLSRPQTLHRAVLKLMALERDMLPMISFPEYNFE